MHLHLGVISVTQKMHCGVRRKERFHLNTVDKHNIDVFASAINMEDASSCSGKSEISLLEI